MQRSKQVWFEVNWFSFRDLSLNCTGPIFVLIRATWGRPLQINGAVASSSLSQGWSCVASVAVETHSLSDPRRPSHYPHVWSAHLDNSIPKGWVNVDFVLFVCTRVGVTKGSCGWEPSHYEGGHTLFHINENVCCIIIHRCAWAGNYSGAVCIMRAD